MLIAACKLSEVWGDFVTIENGSTNVTVKGCTMTTDGRQGIGAAQILDPGGASNWCEHDNLPATASSQTPCAT